MITSIGAELLILRKRASTWILMGVWVLLGMMFSYLQPYLAYRSGTGGPLPARLTPLLPASLPEHLMGGFPFFGGVFALMLGVLVIGSDYGWDTLKTLLMQRSGRLWIIFAKLAALAAGLVGFTVALFGAGAVVSYVIAEAEDAAVHWSTFNELARALAAGWFILAVWAVFGVLLGVLSRGTALAIGLGILYSFVIEGLLSTVAGEVSWLDPFVEYFLRANAYSLVVALGVRPQDLANNGPGSFFGPFVDGGQAAAVLVGYMAIFLLLSAIVLRRRDVL